MKYHLEWLKNLNASEERIKYLFFWGHQPTKDGSIGKSCLSQWWLGEFIIDEIAYKSAEHWMMAEKARLFQDKEMCEKIIRCDAPGEAKKFGRQVRSFDAEIWNAHRYEIVKTGNRYKFGQDENLKLFELSRESRKGK